MMRYRKMLFMSSHRLCFIKVLIRDLIILRDDPSFTSLNQVAYNHRAVKRKLIRSVITMF